MERRHPARDLRGPRWSNSQYLASRTENLDRSYYNNHAAAGARRHRFASPEPGVPPDPHDPERPHRQLRLGQPDRASPHDQGLHAQRALHLVEDARHGDALQRRRPDDGQLRHLARLRPGQLGRAAPAGGQLHLGHAVLPRLRQHLPAQHRRRLADRRHHDDPERHAAQRHRPDRQRQCRLAPTSARISSTPASS